MRIAITFGDPNGIGPEIALRAAAHVAAKSAIRPVLVGDEYIARHYAKRLSIDVPLIPFDTSRQQAGAIAVADTKALDEAAFVPGKLDPRAGRATVRYVEEALKLAEGGQVDAIVGCPHSETAVNQAGIPFNGYVGLVADLTRTPRNHCFMMLIAQGLRIAHVTLHESVSAALARMTPQLVVEAAKATIRSARSLGLSSPKLGIFGINPHAGEDGLFGDDDERITKPAVAILRNEGFQVDGPVGGDLILSQRKHDLYLAMFHDQGHIPIKLVSPLRATALVLGTPVTFASVAHGCGHDIAGQGIADPTGVIEALQLLRGTTDTRAA